MHLTKMRGKTYRPPLFSFFGGLLTLHLLFNILAYYRGKLFLAEQKVSGLLYSQNALMFTSSLLGTVFAGNATDRAFHGSQKKTIFHFRNRFPTPNTNTLEYRPALENHVHSYIDTYQYVQRCLQLGANDVPDPYMFYGHTVMMTNGTGLRGTLCQERFHDPGAYAQIDHLCTGYACVRQQLLLGCIPTHDLYMFHVHDCGRLNQLSSNMHWSTQNGSIVLDDDQNMAG
jgi:hypothetical protein